jgi:hypothetical protein
LEVTEERRLEDRKRRAVGERDGEWLEDDEEDG